MHSKVYSRFPALIFNVCNLPPPKVGHKHSLITLLTPCSFPPLEASTHSAFCGTRRSYRVHCNPTVVPVRRRIQPTPFHLVQVHFSILLSTTRSFKWTPSLRFRSRTSSNCSFHGATPISSSIEGWS